MIKLKIIIRIRIIIRATILDKVKDYNKELDDYASELRKIENPLRILKEYNLAQLILIQTLSSSSRSLWCICEHIMDVWIYYLVTEHCAHTRSVSSIVAELVTDLVKILYVPYIIHYRTLCSYKISFINCCRACYGLGQDLICPIYHSLQNIVLIQDQVSQKYLSQACCLQRIYNTSYKK